MSASTERAARRDLRRAVGEDAVAIIEAQSGILVEQREAIDKLVVIVDAHESRLAVLNDVVGSQLRRTFWQRLRWLVRGR